jgi:hypothetical protein
VAGVGLDVALSAAISNGAITVTLGTDGAGAADDTKNTATLVAAVVDALAGVSATASGNGSGVIPVTGAQAFTSGRDAQSIGDLAKNSLTSDWLVRYARERRNRETARNRTTRGSVQSPTWRDSAQ